VVQTTAPEPVDIFWNLAYNDYEMFPQKFSNRGQYTVVVRSCVPVGATKVCVLSEPWTISVYDPCLTTTIIGDGWT